MSENERAILVTTMDRVWPGMFINEPDDETPVGEIVDATKYNADDGDWWHVRNRTGYVDIPTYTLAYYNGEEFTAKYETSATVWVLVEMRPGRTVWDPVEQEVER